MNTGKRHDKEPLLLREENPIVGLLCGFFKITKIFDQLNPVVQTLFFLGGGSPNSIHCMVGYVLVFDI